MPRPLLDCATVLGVCLLAGVPAPAEAAEDFTFYHENVMGTSLELTVRADREEAARWAEDRVLQTIDRLSKVFSGYDRTSEFSRWQAASAGTGTGSVPARVSRELFEVLAACDRWRAASGGAFDPRVEALTQLWSRCAAQDRMPTDGELSAAHDRMSRPAWTLDPATGTALRLGDCPLSLNAIAKGYIIEIACDAALDRSRGVHGLVLNVGGDLRACGEGRRTIGIASPMADSETSGPLVHVEVQDRAVATSGRSQRGLRIQGRWYSHIFDPRTARTAPAIAGATVIADRSADADALATIANVLAPEETLRLVATLPGVECLIVTTDGQVVRSPGWPRYERARPVLARLAPEEDAAKPAAAAAATATATPSARGPWGDTFEMVVNFEINNPDTEGGRYRRPYVAIWVEDAKGFPVRNVALWVSLGGQGPWEWLKDLKRWHLSDKVRRRVDKRDMVFTMSRPTRPPGKYSVVWDGKDDHGKPLERGDYVLYIDIAREHGTYQSMRAPITIGDTPFTTALEGNLEMKSASLDYHRKGQVK
jgi:thiamine biosynthesis lipoprotein ApbE